MADYLKLACQFLEIDAEQVMGHRVYQENGEIALVVWPGKKYILPFSDLPEEEPDLLPVPAAIDLDSYDISYRELQALAKEAGIPANQSARDLRQALEELTDA